MGFPATPDTRTRSRNDAVSVSRLLRERHEGHFMVWNLAEEAYDYALFDNQVGWPVRACVCGGICSWRAHAARVCWCGVRVRMRHTCVVAAGASVRMPHACAGAVGVRVRMRHVGAASAGFRSFMRVRGRDRMDFGISHADRPHLRLYPPPPSPCPPPPSPR
jgi:hypothetical protein